MTGSVVDTADQPIAGAYILLIDDTANIQDADTVVSTQDGSFSKEIDVLSTALVIFYGAVKPGYTLKTGVGIILLGKVNLGKIVLQKAGGVTVPVKVSGVVLDSLTQNPVEGALVQVSVIGAGLSNPDSVLTGTDGKFSITIAADTTSTSTIQSRAVILVRKDGYQLKQGNKLLEGNTTVDMGTILLSKVISAINNYLFFSKSTIVSQAKVMEVYSLRGQQLYCGKPMHPVEVLKNSSLPVAQPCIITYKKDNKVIYSHKVMTIK